MADVFSNATHAITEFFKLNARNAFAMFVAGVAVWVMMLQGIVHRDAPVELAIGYATAFGLFVGLWLAIEGLFMLRA